MNFFSQQTHSKEQNGTEWERGPKVRAVLQYKMGEGMRERESGPEHTMFVKNWPEEKWCLPICGLSLNTACYLLTTPFFLSRRKQYSISFDIFTVLLLEEVQSLHLVVKESSSCMEAISKSQNTHSEELSLLLTFSEHTVATHHLVPTGIPLKAWKGCQLLYAFTGTILKKCPFADELHFYWYAQQKFAVSPGRVCWF